MAWRIAKSAVSAPNDPPEVKVRKIYDRVQQVRNTSYELRKTDQEEKREKEKAPANVEEVWKRGYASGYDLNWLFLGLVRAAGLVCRGIAFAFEDNDRAPEMLLELQKREACKPRALAVQLEDGRTVTAQVFIYEGRNLIDDSMPLADKADMVARAVGIRGSAFDYVRDTYEGLKGVGIDDPAVTVLWEAVKSNLQRPVA